MLESTNDVSQNWVIDFSGFNSIFYVDLAGDLKHLIMVNQMGYLEQ